LFESSAHNLNVFVPEDYVHEKQINTFIQRFGLGGSQGVQDPRLIDRNFHSVVRLEPGATYSADFYQVVQWGHVSPPEITDFIRQNGGLFVGPHILTLLYEQHWHSSVSNSASWNRNVRHGHWVVAPQDWLAMPGGTDELLIPNFRVGADKKFRFALACGKTRIENDRRFIVVKKLPR
jgi:hypothetical protein